MDDKLILNGVELEFDFTDADNWKKIKAAVNDMSEFDNADVWDMEDPIAGIDHTCKGYRIFFDGVFGEGVYDKIFKGKRSLKQHKAIFAEVMERAHAEMTESASYDDLRNKYNPNRTQRRAEQKRRSRNFNRNFGK